MTPLEEAEERKAMERFSSTRSLETDLEDLGTLSSKIAPDIRYSIERLKAVLEEDNNSTGPGPNESGLDDVTHESDSIGDTDTDDIVEEIKHLNFVEDNLREELEATGLWGEDLKYENFRKAFLKDDSWKLPKVKDATLDDNFDLNIDEIKEIIESKSYDDDDEAEEIEFHPSDAEGLRAMASNDTDDNTDGSSPLHDVDSAIETHESDNFNPTITLPVLSTIDPPTDILPTLRTCHREYLTASPPLSEFLLGFQPTSDGNDYIRTCYVKIRPDVLCGAVMDAVSKVVENHEGELTKRQGGHLRAGFETCGMDTQLCMKKTMERVLVIGIYKSREGEMTKKRERRDGDLLRTAVRRCAEEGGRVDGDAETARTSFYQDVLTSPMKMISSKIYSSEDVSQDANDNREVNEHPCLRKENQDIVNMGYDIILEIIDELEMLDLAYCTLATTTFGSFPSLPTLDVHFISQIRLLSRESMVFSMLQSASELETFAREAEMNAIATVKLLVPKYQNYGAKLPEFPKLLSLSAYPLEFVPPEVSFPPWGQKVMSAMEQISAQSTSSTPITCFDKAPTIEGFQKADEACDKIFNAFQVQDGQEQSARLDRKNMQVMDRLAKCEGWKRESTMTLRQFYGINKTVTKRAGDFRKKTLKLTENPLPPSSCVPLYLDYVELTSPEPTTRAYCTISSHQIHFQCSSGYKIWQSSRAYIFDIASTKVKLAEGVITLCVDEREALSFRPSIPAKDWKQLLEMIRDCLEPSENKLLFSSRGGLLFNVTNNGGNDSESSEKSERDALV